MPQTNYDNQLVGKPRIAKLLGVTHATASMYAAQGRFPTEEIDGRAFARVGDVLAFRDRRDAEKKKRRA